VRSSLPAEPVVLITGGSSGLGLSTAHAFARKQARIVLVSRSISGLTEAAEKCGEVGAAVRVHAAEMSDAAAVEELRAKVAGEFGRIDVWVNCAALLLFGRFEDVPQRDFERVIQANIVGYANGARAALKQFRLQGNRGTLINVASVLGMVSEPYVSAYVATKFAIRGLSACLRQELRNDSEIHVCAVLPAALDTPIYQKAGNYFGWKARSIFPVYSPERAATIIVRLAERPRAEILVGGFAYAVALGARLAPGLLQRLIGKAAFSLQFQPETSAAGSGNLFESIAPGSARGGWIEYWRGKMRAGRNGRRASSIG
jgi:short-subunit dehydrogenase